MAGGGGLPTPPCLEGGGCFYKGGAFGVGWDPPPCQMKLEPAVHSKSHYFGALLKAKSTCPVPSHSFCSPMTHVCCCCSDDESSGSSTSNTSGKSTSSRGGSSTHVSISSG